MTAPAGPPMYKGEPLDAERGPGLGCFWIQVSLLAILSEKGPDAVEELVLADSARRASRKRDDHFLAVLEREDIRSDGGRDDKEIPVDLNVFLPEDRSLHGRQHRRGDAALQAPA